MYKTLAAACYASFCQLFVSAHNKRQQKPAEQSRAEPRGEDRRKQRRADGNRRECKRRDQWDRGGTLCVAAAEQGSKRAATSAAGRRGDAGRQADSRTSQQPRPQRNRERDNAVRGHRNGCARVRSSQLCNGTFPLATATRRAAVGLWIRSPAAGRAAPAKDRRRMQWTHTERVSSIPIAHPDATASVQTAPPRCPPSFRPLVAFLFSAVHRLFRPHCGFLIAYCTAQRSLLQKLTACRKTPRAS
jgi:hypothetical protein